MNENTFEIIRNIIAEGLDINESDIHLEMSFSEDLDMDSLDAITFLLAFEEIFKIEIDDEDIDSACTIKDLVEYIDSKLSSKN